MRTLTGVSVVVIATFLGMGNLANAQADSSIERQKKHIVSRVYEAIYETEEWGCSPSEGSAHVKKMINRARQAFPELFSLVDASPYFPQAREESKAFLNRIPLEMRIHNCKAIEYILEEVFETPGGQKGVNDMIQTLKQ
jgi:hypothetical protein